MNKESFDIIGNMNTIDSYKTCLVGFVADLFSTMHKSRGNTAYNDEIIDEIADIIICSYLISKRISISYDKIDKRIMDKLKVGLLEDNESERREHDYASLIAYLKEIRNL
ncbi:MAG: MazG-like family protein [Clostridium sp.]|uniref:MazG-like family protein n=1 Tax=Clostridium sp. TaxID=1506 RepID=UPI002FC6F524